LQERIVASKSHVWLITLNKNLTHHPSKAWTTFSRVCSIFRYLQSVSLCENSAVTFLSIHGGCFQLVVVNIAIVIWCYYSYLWILLLIVTITGLPFAIQRNEMHISLINWLKNTTSLNHKHNQYGFDLEELFHEWTINCCSSITSNPPSLCL
jgi:hypothetical protein